MPDKKIKDNPPVAEKKKVDPAVITAVIGLLSVIITAIVAPVVTKWVDTKATLNQPNTSITQTPLPSSNPSRLEVLSLYQSFSSPSDYPGEAFGIPRHVRTSGKVIGNNRNLWFAVCPKQQEICNIKRLRLDASGEWNNFIDIGGEADYCTIFDVIFVIVDEATNKLFIALEPSGMPQVKFEESEFEAHIPFAVRPVLDANNQLTSLCQTASH